MKPTTKILFILALLITIVISVKATSYFYSSDIAEYKLEIKKYKIKNDTLVKLKDGLYTRLVADTATIRDLKYKVDSLELKVKTPTIITEIEFIPIEVEKPIDIVIVKDSILKIQDFYPNKEYPFIKYSARYNLETGLSVGKFNFNPIEISLGIGENLDGTYSINTKVPEYFKINKVEVTSLPMEPIKQDRFGWLVGGGLGTNILDNSKYFVGSVGIRIKKVYLDIDIGTNSSLEGKLKIEF